MGKGKPAETGDSEPREGRPMFPRWVIWLLLVAVYIGQTVVLGMLVMDKEETLTRLREENAARLKEMNRLQRRVRELEERVDPDRTSGPGSSY